MKRLLMLALITMFVAAFAFATTASAQEDDCPCGMGEDGECIPCDE